MTQPYVKPPFEVAIDEFVEADKRYQEIEEQFMTGNILRELLVPGTPPERIIEEFRLVIEEMKKLLEDRNSKLMTAKNAFRATVQLGPSQWRGPDGKPTTASYGPFMVSSVTRRSLDPQTLLTLAKERGFVPDLMALKTINKEGQEVSLVKTAVAVDYEGVLSWLKQRGLTDVIEGAYDEKEGTPMVKGPKQLAFFGEKKKDD